MSNTSIRQSNFELLRLVCMLMVMVGHAIGYIQEEDLAGINGVCKMTVGLLCLVCVNVFVMISGWFGIRASWRGAAKLLFQVLFLSTACFLFCWALGIPVSFRKDLLPNLLFGSGYWFVVSYLILYALSPVLNAFSERASRIEFIGALVAFFLAEFIFGFTLDAGHFDYGFSPLFFIGLYLLASYARRFPDKLFSLSKKQDLFLYLGATLLSMIGFWFGYKLFGMGFHLNHYDSPLAVVASLYFLLFFSKLDFHSKTVNWMAVSAFAIYLIHENNLIRPYYRGLFQNVSSHFSLVPTAAISFFIIICIAFLCILADKPRILIWRLITRRTSTHGR